MAWQVGYSSLIEGREQAGIAAQLQQELAQGSTTLPELPEGPLVPGAAPSLDDGAVIAILRAPRFGTDWARPVYAVSYTPLDCYKRQAPSRLEARRDEHPFQPEHRGSQGPPEPRLRTAGGRLHTGTPVSAASVPAREAAARGRVPHRLSYGLSVIHF